ncbi:MAG: hypothetical protein QXL15_04940, partial [Candidatus Korarchaeota archaeon]
LICVDIVDTGTTLASIKEKFAGVLKIKTAALHCKPHTTVRPDYYSEETTKWIVYPWEIGETLRKLGQKIGMENAVKTLIEIGAPKDTVEMVLKFVKEKK